MFPTQTRRIMQKTLTLVLQNKPRASHVQKMQQHNPKRRRLRAHKMHMQVLILLQMRTSVAEQPPEHLHSNEQSR